jgi:hypothetical protein
LGYILTYHKTKLKIELNLFLLTIAFVLCYLMVFEGIDFQKEKRENKLGKIVCVLFLSVRYPVWAIGVAYIIYACVTSQAFLINWFLTLTIWTPLSRISFSAYLIHEFVIKPYVYSLSKPMHFQESNIVSIYSFCSNSIIYKSIDSS